MEFEECFGPATNGGATAREAEPSDSCGILRELSREEKIDRRRSSYAKRDSSRINILDRFEHWCDLLDTWVCLPPSTSSPRFEGLRYALFSLLSFSL